MRKAYICVGITSILIFAVSCVFNLDQLDSISGNGNVTRQSREVPEFTGIKVSSGIDVYLTQGDVQSVEVEADENLHEWIRTEVSGGVLRIFSEKSIRSARNKDVHVTCKTLDLIDISSAGDVNSTNRFKTGDLKIDLSSAGDLEFEVDAGQIDLSMSSAGNADLKGTARGLKVDLSSAGDLDAYELQAQVADISVSSAGTAKVFVTEEASFRASSAGSIHYRGNPKIRSINTSSAGSVNKKD